MTAFAAIGFRHDLLRGQLSHWLDHFRWLSALMVAMSHLRNLILPDARGQALNLFERAFYFVTLFATEAVVVFFVLSGLLVGGSVLRGLHDGRFAIRKYAVDRATRLAVGLIPAIALTIALQWASLAPDCVRPDSAVAIGANLLFVQNFTDDLLCNNNSLWSLSNEAYCYVIGACLIAAVYVRSATAAALFCLFLLPGLMAFELVRSTPLFTLGLWLCGLVPWFVRLRIPAVFAAAPLVAVLVLGRIHLFPSEIVEEVALAGSFTLLLCSNLQARTAPAARLAKLAAGFSYSLYLVQMPLSQLAAALLGVQSLPNGEAASYLIYGGWLGAIVAVAWLFGHLFEKRTHWMRTVLTRRSPPAPTS